MTFRIVHYAISDDYRDVGFSWASAHVAKRVLEHLEATGYADPGG